MFFIAFAFKGQVHVFAEQVKVVSHSSCRTSTNIEIFLSLAKQIFEGIKLNDIVEGPFSLSINLAPTILTCISQAIFEIKHCITCTISISP